MKRRTALALFAFLVSVAPAMPQKKGDNVAVFVTGADGGAPVAQSLIKKLNESKPFEAVTKEDPSKVVVLITCMDREPTDPFVCIYVSQYNGAAFKSFLGGGGFVSTSADAVASQFFGSIAQDVVERYNDTDKSNLRQALEACLFLTDSKCNVPDPLQKELDAKQLPLGQYILKKNR